MVGEDGGARKKMASVSERDYNRLVAQLHYQQRAIATLEAEKRELERKLSELRRGIGVTVCIQGQTMSLTSPVVTVVNQSTEPPDPGITGIFPMMTDPTPEEPGSTPNAQSRHRYNPSPYGAQAGQYGRSGSGSLLSQSSWRRDSRDQGDRRGTPSWLQDEATEWPPLSTPRVTQARPATRVSRPRPPYAGPVEPPQFSTLANLTGQHPSARQAETSLRHPQDPNPYSDSFVLG
jgi:hypothetical protein